MRLAVRIIGVLVSTLTLAAASTAKPYTVPNTEIRRLHSSNTGAAYELFIAKPPNYDHDRNHYPVVYLLDADYSFALTRNIVQHFVERENLPPLILVAIAYPGAARDRTIYRMNRTRDYTPVYAPDGGYGTEYQKVSGGAPRFRAFIKGELVPFIERNYRVDKSDRTIVGHSYGGLFATYILLNEPALFKRYIIVSPSLWYSNRIAITMTQSPATFSQQTRVFFAVGSEENQPDNERAMVDDLKEFVARLKKKKSERLTTALKIFDGETHNSVFPAAVTRGLTTVFAGEN